MTLVTAQELPWSPLFTRHRAGLPEVTVYGVLSVWAGTLGPLFNVGEVEAPLWSRSLMKPFQLLVLMPELQAAYPELEPGHFALMMASHNAEPAQLAGLQGILDIGGIKESQLLCPACFGLSEAEAFRKQAEGLAPSPLFHPCSGKHLAMLLALKAKKKALKNYLDPTQGYYKRLRVFLGWLLNREADTFLEATDGCGMPMLALSAQEMAMVYCSLTQALPLESLQEPPEEVERLLPYWGMIRSFMLQEAALIGGAGRLDSRLMQGHGRTVPNRLVLAKEGADGLLGIGLIPQLPFKNGLGMLIKLAGGYDPAYLETVYDGLLTALGLAEGEKPGLVERQATGQETQFHFEPLIGTAILDDALVL